MDPRKGLFYGNFSIPNLGFLASTHGISTVLEETTTPFYVWTDVGSITEFEQTILSIELQQKFNTEGLTIFLYEIMSSNFLELDSIQIFVKNNNLTNVTVNACEYNVSLIQYRYPEFKIQTFDIYLRCLKDSAAFHNLTNNITKHFWCGNLRYAVHRHLIVAYLTAQYRGNYSWHFSCKYDVLANNRWFNFEKLKQADINRFNKLKNGIDLLENNQLIIDIDTLPITVDNCYKFYSPDSDYLDKSEKVVNSYVECFCAIVTETTYDSVLGYISEKPMRAISARLPFIIVAGPNSLEYLKKLGFKTFDRWWDESYDQELDHTERMRKIFDLIDMIGNKSINELQAIYNEMSDIFDHNIEVLNTLSDSRLIL
jgi:hypothetical protein